MDWCYILRSRYVYVCVCAAATYASSSTAPAAAPGSDSSDEYGLTPEAPSALVQHG